MNDTHGITQANLLRTLPQVLQNDTGMYALAAPIAELLAERKDEIASLLLYKQIDNLPGDLLDILAYDFKVDWWNPDYTLAEKRRTLKDSWRVHRTLGTKAAVETALSAIYPHVQVQEWFEYGGKPAFFRVLIGASEEGITPAMQRAILERVQYYKSIRSHLESLVIPIDASVQERIAFLLQTVRLSIGVNVLGLQTVYLDGRKSLDGSWVLSLSFERGLTMPNLRISFGQKMIHGTGQGLNTMGAAQTNDETNLCFGLLTTVDSDHHGQRLDGRKRLDGSWTLSFCFDFGLTLPDFGSLTKQKLIYSMAYECSIIGTAQSFYCTAWRIQLPITVGVICHRPSLQNFHLSNCIREVPTALSSVQSISTVAVSKVFTTGLCAVQTSLLTTLSIVASSNFHTECTAAISSSAVLVENTMWRLDSMQLLEGSKRLNADTIRSDL